MKKKNEAPIFEKLRREVPNPKQQRFFCSTARYTAYGGARGGGKSYAMRRKLVMLAMRYPKLRLLLLRRTLQELRENHLLPLQSDLLGYAEYKKEERTFVFPNGSRLTLGYCDSDSDVLQYQGAEYDVIGFEEATQLKEEWMVFISTALRTMTRALLTMPCNAFGRWASTPCCWTARPGRISGIAMPAARPANMWLSRST